MNPSRNAVVLLSGGLDSATTLAIARADGFTLHALSFEYGQRHSAEIAAARRVASAMGVVRHHVIQIDLRAFGGSALTDDLAVPLDRTPDQMAAEIPVTYVPARNTIFLAYALAAAEVIAARDIFIGVNAVDYSGYPDCRPQFIHAFEQMANLATRAAVEGRRVSIHSPLINLSKAAIIQRGLSLGVDYGMTLTCYRPNGSLACGRCDACQLRLRGFREVGIPDPAQYSER